MKSSIIHFVIAVVLFICSSAINITNKKGIQNNAEVPYPEGYRSWKHIKTYIVMPKNPAFKIIGGFNHVYGNEKALQGYATGYFPNGSVIVSDVIEALADTMITAEGQRNHIDVMVRDSLKYDDFGEWRFETFDKNSHKDRMLNAFTRTDCNNCHKKYNSDMVFSKYRE